MGKQIVFGDNLENAIIEAVKSLPEHGDLAKLGEQLFGGKISHLEDGMYMFESNEDYGGGLDKVLEDSSEYVGLSEVITEKTGKPNTEEQSC